MGRPVSSGINIVRRKRADGSVSLDFYHRRTGALIGRSRDGMTREVAIARAQEMDGETRSGPPAGSFGELCSLYLASPAFKKRAPRTQAEYRDHIEIMRTMWEEVPLTGITRKAVRTLHAQYEDRPWRGNAILRTLRRVLNYGIHDLELADLAKNPAAHPDLYDTAPRTEVWDQARIDAFLAAATALRMPRLRKALALLLYTVQRPGDVLTMAKPMMWEGEDGRWWIRLRQAKTGEPVDVPCHARLAEELLAPDPPLKPRKTGEAPTQSTLLLPSPRGLPWRYRNFARAWDRVRARANLRLARKAIAARGGLPSRSRPEAREKAKAAIAAGLLGGLQRRDLRRTGVVQMALAGATTPQIAALGGWGIDYTQRIIDTYLPRKGEVALGGVERWERAGEGRVVVLASRRRDQIR